MTEAERILCADIGELGERAAARFARLATESVHRNGRFAVALAGGDTPRSTYRHLASEYADKVPWKETHLFWGDERCVPPDHPDSNYRMACDLLIRKVPIPEDNVHRMPGEEEPGAAAAAYEQELRRSFRLRHNEIPRFDLVLLGVGEDGHTASLFPGSAVLEDSAHLVVACYVEKLRSHRLTLTLPVLNNAAHVHFLIAGANKAPVVRALWSNSPGAQRLPAARVKPRRGHVTWFVTRETAAEYGA